MADICVAHLARASNGPEPFQNFLESYGRNDGGLKHELLVIFKGFNEGKEPVEYERFLVPYPHKSLFVPDHGFDVDAYFAASSGFDCGYFCFLNSFSILLDKDWLSKMYRAISEKDVGLVGATGSYESMYTDQTEAYRNVIKPLSFFSPLRLRVRCRLAKWKRQFAMFPNYHVRTNGFMISAELMRKIKHKTFSTKFDAWRFESGKNGLTSQILNMNLRALIVGKDGRSYEKEDWFRSNTFWQGEQANLLVADNQTKTYMKSDLEEKRRLSRLAWGDKAGFLQQ